MSRRQRNGDITSSSVGSFLSLVQLAVDSDDPAPLITAAGAILQCPLGLVDANGEALAHAPDDDEGRRALAVARAGARHRLVAPPGWAIVPLGGGARLGFLAIGGNDAPGAEIRTLLDLLPVLLTDQLNRAAVLRVRRAALMRRIATDPRVDPDLARREASDLGLRLAETYWAGLLVWRNVPPSTGVIDAVDRQARTLVPDSLTVALDGRVILLHPGTGRPGLDTVPRRWFEGLVREARRLAPSSRAQAIVGEVPAGLSSLGAHVGGLQELLHFGPRADEDLLVASADQFALERLSADIDPLLAASFVEERLGALLDWDRRHRGDLLNVLEAGLDFPRCDRAAAKCFMHRNTFRHRLRQAEEILGARLEDPDARLAVHVALKLRKLVAARSADQLGAGS